MGSRSKAGERIAWVNLAEHLAGHEAKVVSLAKEGGTLLTHLGCLEELISEAEAGYDILISSREVACYFPGSGALDSLTTMAAAVRRDLRNWERRVAPILPPIDKGGERG